MDASKGLDPTPEQSEILPELLDRHLGNHGLRQGLSNGTLGMGWLAYILYVGRHRYGSG